MSTPVDFVGLNTLIVKNANTEKNTTNNLLKQKPFVIQSDNPLVFNRKDIMIASSDEEREAKYFHETSETGFARTYTKSFSINIKFKVNDRNQMRSTNLTAVESLSGVPYLAGDTVSTSTTDYVVVGTNLHTDDPDGGGAGGASRFGVGLVRSGLEFGGNRLRVVIYNASDIIATEKLITYPSEIHDITIVFYDNEDDNYYKSSKSDRISSTVRTQFSGTDTRRITAALFVDGEHLGRYTEGNYINEVMYNLHAVFRVKGLKDRTQDSPQRDIDDHVYFFQGITGDGFGGLITDTTNVADFSLYSIATWDRSLTEQEVIAIHRADENYYFNRDKYSHIPFIDNTNGLKNTIPKEKFLYINTEYEKSIADFSEQNNPGYAQHSSIGVANDQLNLSVYDSDGTVDEVLKGKATVFSSYYNNFNGPYGYSLFKQLRASQNWLMRLYNKNNIFSFVSEKGDTITVTKDGKILSTHKTKYGDIQNLTETPVSEQHKPLEMIATISDGFDDEKLSIKGTYSNETQFFKNKAINVETSREIEDSETYEDLKALTDKETTPLKSFDKLTLKQSVFPKNIYTHSRNHRTRPTYSSKIWRDQRASRTELDLNNGFGYYTPSQSFWPLDAEENFTTLPTTNYYGGALGYNSSGAAGVLQNSYSLFATSSDLSGVDVDNVVSASILYARPHTLTASTSVRNPFFTNLSGGTIGDCSKFTGHAAWEAPDMAGFFNTDGNFQLSPKKPFPDSYDEWAESFRGLGKGYSVVPEFRISDHVNHYLTNGFTSQKLDFLDVKGGNQDYAKSSDQDFFKVYSTTDFLKNFEIVKEDFENKATPTGITLRCKAIKKFLPYEGFYPCQRTVDLSKQFYDSYGFFISGSSWSTHPNGTSVSGAVADVSSTSKYISQNLMTPLFSPGILFNSIKSGIACDFPVMTDSYYTSSYSYGNVFSSDFGKRIPFEALMEPEKHLANYELFSMEPDSQSPKTKSIWTGQGDNLYKLMINNFVSEVGDFFLENERHTTIASLPEGDPNFGNVQPGKVYGMRIKMFRSITGSKGTETPYNGTTYGIPQDNGDMGESFTMYSRPSAFGPPTLLSSDLMSGFPNFEAKTWTRFKFTGSIDFSYIEGYTLPPATSLLNSSSLEGYNFSFTPPYYHGEAWADIFFQPPDGAKKYSLSEIINNSSVEFLRHYVSSSDSTVNIKPQSLLINDQAMQIASSMNIFSRGILREDSESLTINTQLETKYRWIIQSKWETPTLNFNHLSHEDLTMPPSHVSASVPIGMWHQYGRLPQRTDEGVFIQVTDIPSNWIEGAMLGDLNKTGSLVDLCGFSTDPIRVGEIKNTKTIEEAVVAVPFVNRNGFREFFKLNKNDVANAISGVEEAVSPTVFKLTQQLDKYVFPPQFDYKRNQDIAPVAMYVFEFSHEFTKQDLADIWQNLPPKLGEVHETAEATISHALFAEEFLGKGADPKKTENGIERNIVSELTDLPSDIQWMVFKVKKRAKSNYFEKMFQRNESRDSDGNTNFTVDSTGKKSDVSYNWPYDFFSMVELIKLDAEVEFSNVDEQKSKEEKKLVTKPYIFRED